MSDSSATQSGRGGDGAVPDQGRPRTSLFPLLLALLALLDLRIDLQLLLDHFTFTTLITALTTHPLAVVVLVAQPSLWRRYTSRR